MERLRDYAYDARKKAEKPTFEKIRADLRIEGLPQKVKNLLEHLPERLFDSDFDVTRWLQEVGCRDNGIYKAFRGWLGATPRVYLEICRLETAARMLAATHLEPHRIGRVIGFKIYRTFKNAYEQWAGHSPDEHADRPSPPVDLPTWQRTFHGELKPEEAEEVLAALRRIYPEASPDSPRPPEAPATREAIDGGSYERYRAEDLWQRIRPLAFEDQKQHVSKYLFSSTVLFDLLRKKSREEGRKDRAQGVQLAELALASLEGHEENFGERIYDLRALGWAWLANARCLMLDFEGAEVDLLEAERDCSVPARARDVKVSAEIQLIKSGLRMCQRRYDEALEWVKGAIRLAKRASDPVLQAHAYTIQASVNRYLERPRESATDLQQASCLIEGENEPYLDFTIKMNQTNVDINLGNRESAAKNLLFASSCCEKFDHPLGWHEIQHVEGNLNELTGDVVTAEKSYLAALQGFLSFNEPRLAVILSLDLAILDSRQGRTGRALELARWSIPILQSMQLYEETVAAIEVLARESAASRVNATLLAEVSRLLGLDPLVPLGSPTEAGRIARPPCV